MYTITFIKSLWFNSTLFWRSLTVSSGCGKMIKRQIAHILASAKFKKNCMISSDNKQHYPYPPSCHTQPSGSGWCKPRHSSAAKWLHWQAAQTGWTGRERLLVTDNWRKRYSVNSWCICSFLGFYFSSLVFLFLKTKQYSLLMNPSGSTLERLESAWAYSHFSFTFLNTRNIVITKKENAVKFIFMTVAIISLSKLLLTLVETCALQMPF